jgi:hypothetical protein
VSVIGCVWGAHRQLVDLLEDGAPSYEWCERQWSDRLSKRAPAPAALPAWLFGELHFIWTRGLFEEQLAFEVSA